jgi:hypothetical protein
VRHRVHLRFRLYDVDWEPYIGAGRNECCRASGCEPPACRHVRARPRRRLLRICPARGTFSGRCEAPMLGSKGGPTWARGTGSMARS